MVVKERCVGKSLWEFSITNKKNLTTNYLTDLDHRYYQWIKLVRKYNNNFHRQSFPKIMHHC